MEVRNFFFFLFQHYRGKKYTMIKKNREEKKRFKNEFLKFKKI